VSTDRLGAETPFVAFDGVAAVPIVDAVGAPIDPTRRSSVLRDARYLMDFGAYTRVPTSVCEHIRRRRHHSVSSETLSEELGICSTAVKYHARGDCEHADTVPPARGQTTRWQCACWRRRSRLGETVAEILERAPSGVAHRRVELHVRGECAHGDELVAANPRRTVDRKTCRLWRRRYRNESGAEIAEDSQWTPAAVRKHGSGRCSHEVSTLE